MFLALCGITRAWFDPSRYWQASAAFHGTVSRALNPPGRNRRGDEPAKHVMNPSKSRRKSTIRNPHVPHCRTVLVVGHCHQPVTCHGPCRFGPACHPWSPRGAPSDGAYTGSGSTKLPARTLTGGRDHVQPGLGAGRGMLATADGGRRPRFASPRDALRFALRRARRPTAAKGPVH